MLSKRDYILSDKEKSEVELYNYVPPKPKERESKTPVYPILGKVSESGQRENVRSPLVTGNYFSNFDRIVEQKLNNVGISTINYKVPIINSEKPDAVNKSSMSTYSKGYSRRKMVLNRDKSSRQS